MENVFSSIPELIEEARAGRLIVLVDGPDRENEGDFFIPAEIATSQHIATMITEGRGLVCAPITRSQAARLGLPRMVSSGESLDGSCNFAASVDAREGITTGISASDRAHTVHLLADLKSTSNDFVRPGHMFPLIAHDAGLSARRGHTEASVTLAELAGFAPAGVICEIIQEDGTLARLPELQVLAKRLGIKIGSIEDLAAYIEEHPLPSAVHPKIAKTAEAQLPTKHGKFRAVVYKTLDDNREHIALTLGKPEANALVRIHSQCVTGDTFGSLLCDCGAQLEKSFEEIALRGSGIVLYLNQEGRGIGLGNKMKAYALQAGGLDTVDANTALGFPSDARDFTIAAEILELMEIRTIELLTNNPAKVNDLESRGITVARRIPLEIVPSPENVNYLKTKKEKLGHQLHLV